MQMALGFISARRAHNALSLSLAHHRNNNSNPFRVLGDKTREESTHTALLHAPSAQLLECLHGTGLINSLAK
jgi:hypothetical protein